MEEVVMSPMPKGRVEVTTILEIGGEIKTLFIGMLVKCAVRPRKYFCNHFNLVMHCIYDKIKK